MKGANKISSTENLLEMIRGNLKIEPPAATPPAAGGGKPRGGSILPRGVRQKGPNVGIFTNDDALRLARMDVAGGAYRLEEFKAFPYPGELNPYSEAFPAFLKASLQKFGVNADCRLWAVLPSDQVEVFYLKIPKSADKELSGAIYWAMQREKKFAEQHTIFDYTILGEVMDKGIPRLQVVCYLAQRATVQAIQRLYRQAGFPLTGLTFEAAAVNNLLRVAGPAQSVKSLAHVHIDREWSRIDLFHENNFIFNRNIKTGSNSFVESIQENAAGARPAAATGEVVMELAPEAGDELDPEAAEAIFQAHLKGDAAAIAQAGNYTPAEVQGMIAPALDRLINQIERTLDYHIQTLNFPKAEKLLLSGAAALFPGLADYLHDQLGLPVEIMDPFVSAGMSGVAIHAPTSHGERILYAVPLGLALSDAAYTPNFLHTYKEKELARKNRLVNRAVAAGVLLLVGITLVFYSWQAGIRAEHRAELKTLQTELAAFGPELEAAYLSQLFAEVRRNKDETGRSLVRHKPLAVLAEISAATASPNIRLHSILLDAADKGTSGKGSLILDGFVSGDRQMLDAYLTSYIVRLQASGMLGNARLQKTSEESYPELGTVLKFTLSVQYS